MKGLLLAMLAVVVIGAGCATNVVEVAPPTNIWYITFENGQQWFAYKPYFGAADAFGQPAERTTNRAENRVWLQNTSRPVLPKSFTPRDDMIYDATDAWVAVDVTVYPSQARMPDDVEMVRMGDRDIGVRRRRESDNYYWKSPERLYEMYFYSGKGTDVGVEAVLSTIAESSELSS